MKPSASARLRREPPATRLLALEQLEHALDRGDRGGVDLARPAPLASRQLVHVAEQPEAGDVGERVRAGRARLRGGGGR